LKLLVTGGAGFIGSNFVRYTLQKYPHYEIVVLDKLTYAGNLESLEDIKNNPNYRFVKGDICDSKIVNESAEGCEIIVNFAAQTHVDRSIMEAGSFVTTDVYGTYTLLEAAKKFKTSRFIHISTDEVYGSIEKGSFKETDPLKPNSPYAASKAGADLLVRSYYVTHKIPAIITRSSNNFGPYQHPEKLIPLFITNTIEARELPLYGDGMNVRDWLYVIDNCRAIDLVLHEGKPGQIYNVGADNPRANIETTKMILKLLDKSETLIKLVQDRPGHDRRYSLDSNKIKKLGWKVSFDFEKAMKKTVKWYLDNKEWWQKIKKKNKEFQEYYQKQYGKSTLSPRGNKN